MAQFRTKARAVDLLGKGQIADLATAISELWKNGYDAYASKLGCDIYTQGYEDVKSPIMVVSDNGFGMSQEDVLSKWIVLGTDSKAKGTAFYDSETRFGLKPRVSMGEKGIGRLSVSFLGSPMLMITKKNGLPCQLLLMDWRILENYNLFVDDVDIPLMEMTEWNLSTLLQKMKYSLILNLHGQKEKWKEQVELFNAIQTDIKSAKIPNTVERWLKNNFGSEASHGTAFVVFKPIEQLQELTSTGFSNGSNSLTDIRKSLSGLYNVFVQKPDFTVNFTIHNSEGSYEILKDFFRKDDFGKADHYIKGSFDENGYFTGSVRVFSKTYEYQFRAVRTPGKTPYGAFDIEVGAMEGSQKNSPLNAEEYALMDSKTDEFGGLYIYRDGFRVLPYGRSDYDFLQFEERRMKRAGDYFFSHKKMFGYIAITREGNHSLTDKAGREGFVENKAYREFKSDLIDFFIDIAKTYLSTAKEGESNARSAQIESINEKKKKTLESETRQNKQTLSAFAKTMYQNMPEIEVLESDIDILVKKIEFSKEKVDYAYDEYRGLMEELERKKTRLRELKLVKPSRITLNSIVEKQYDRYTESYNTASAKVEQCLTEIVELRSKFDVENLRTEFLKQSDRMEREISFMIKKYADRYKTATNRINEQFQEERREKTTSFRQKIGEKDISLITREGCSAAIESVRKLADSFMDDIEKRYLPLVNHVENMNFDVDDDFLVGWYKEQAKHLEERLQDTEGLAQLGISVEIIDHELNVLYGQMANSIKSLRTYANNHTDIENVVHQLSNSFLHIEQNYKMLQPLYRTTRRARTEFTGATVLDNVRTFFSNKISQLEVCIEGNEDFLKYEFFTFESVIFSTFINIVNNALYWLISVSNRKVYVEYRKETQEILIMNNGEPIKDKYLEDIFTLFFTRKRDGRGIGLYLARKSLATVGMTIRATNDPKYNKLNGACFVITLND